MPIISTAAPRAADRLGVRYVCRARPKQEMYPAVCKHDLGGLQASGSEPSGQTTCGQLGQSSEINQLSQRVRILLEIIESFPGGR